MNHTQITQCLKSIATILKVIAEDLEFQVIASNPYEDPDLATDMGDAQHYISEMIWKLESQQKATNPVADSNLPQTNQED